MYPGWTDPTEGLAFQKRLADPYLFLHEFFHRCQTGDTSTLQIMMDHPSMEVVVQKPNFFKDACASAFHSPRESCQPKPILECLLSHKKYGKLFQLNESIVFFALRSVFHQDVHLATWAFLLSHPSLNGAIPRSCLISHGMAFGGLTLYDTICCHISHALLDLQLASFKASHFAFPNSIITLRIRTPVHFSFLHFFYLFSSW